MNYSETKGRVERPIIPTICAGVVLISLISVIATWWFVLFNPSPVPVAKEYVGAMNAAMAGDGKKLAAICTPESQASIDSMVRVLGQVLGQMRMRGFAAQINMTVGKVESVTVTGDTAQVRLNVNSSISTMQMQVSKPMPVALVRGGSILRRQWKVDMVATNRLAAENDKAMLQKAFPGGIPNMPGVPPSVTMPSTPQNRNR